MNHKKTPKTDDLHLRIPDNMARQLQQLAELTESDSISTLVRSIIKQFFEEKATDLLIKANADLDPLEARP